MSLGTLKIELVCLQGLALNGFPSTKTYISCSLSPSEKYKTRSVSGPEPQYHETLSCHVTDKSMSTLYFEVYNEDMSRPGIIGTSEYNLDKVYLSAHKLEEWISVRTTVGGPLGDLLVKFKFLPSQNVEEKITDAASITQQCINTAQPLVSDTFSASIGETAPITQLPTITTSSGTTPGVVASITTTSAHGVLPASVLMHTVPPTVLNTQATIADSQHYPIPTPLHTPTPTAPIPVVPAPVTPITVATPQPVSIPPLSTPPIPAPSPLPPSLSLPTVPKPVMPRKDEKKNKSNKKGASSDWVKVGSAAIAGAAIEGIGHWVTNKLTSNEDKKKKKQYETFEKAMNEKPYRSASFRTTEENSKQMIQKEEEDEEFYDAKE